MLTTALIVAAVGGLVGGGLGWKLGRSYERLRGAPKDKSASRERKGKA